MSLIITLIETLILMQIVKIYFFSHTVGFILAFVFVFFTEAMTAGLENILSSERAKKLFSSKKKQANA